MSEENAQNDRKYQIEEVFRFKRAVAINPVSAENHYNLGLALFHSNDLDSAMEEFKIAVRLDPKNASARYNLALCYQSLGFSDSAITTYEQVLFLDPKDHQAWFNLGVLHMDQRDFAKSAYCFNQSASIDADNSETLKFLSLSEYYGGELSKAEETATRATTIKTDDAFLWAHLGIVLAAQDKTSESIEAFTRALDLNEAMAEIWNNLGISYLGLGQTDKAEEAYNRAIDTDPTNSTYWFNLGELQFDQDRLDEAEKSFLKVTEFHSEDYQAWIYLAKCQAGSDVEAAIASFIKAMELGGGNANSYDQLAKLYHQAGNRESELKMRLKLFDINQYHGENNYEIGKIYLEIGKPELGYRFLNQCQALSDRDISTWFLLSQYFRLKSKDEEELHCLTKVVEQDANHQEAWLRLGWMALENKVPYKAMRYLEQGAGAAENDLSFWQQVINEFLNQSEPDKAVQCCAHILHLLIDSPTSWDRLFGMFQQNELLDNLVSWLGTVLMEMNREDLLVINTAKIMLRWGYNPVAQSLLERSQQNAPENPEIGVHLARLYLLGRQTEQATVLVDRYLQQFPHHADLLILSGMISLLSGEIASAESRFSAASKLRVDDIGPLAYLSETAIRKNEYTAALDFIDQALDLDDRPGFLWRQKGRVLDLQDRPEEAEKYLWQAIDLDRNDSVAWQLMGKCYLKRNKLDSARIALLRSLAIDCMNVSVWTALQNLYKKFGDSPKAGICRKWGQTAEKVPVIEIFPIVR